MDNQYLQPGAQTLPLLYVTCGPNPSDQRDYQFRTTFRIGRTDECEICIQEEHVSRCHAEVRFEDGLWCVRDLNSSNGIYVGDRRVKVAYVADALTCRLGIEGPAVTLRVEAPKPVRQEQAKPIQPPPLPLPPPPRQPTPQAPPNLPPGNAADLSHYLQHYFGSDANAGERTIMVRMAYQHLQKKQKSKYGIIIAALAVLVVAVGAFAGYEYYHARHQKALAEDLFYAMKSIDVEIADSERALEASGSPNAQAQVHKYQGRRKDLEASYDRFLSTLRTYDKKMTEEERLVLRVARIFGECELEMPPGFSAEISNYIKKWKSTGRFKHSLQVAQEKGYTKIIAEELLAQDLPPQFFYLAMQESGFDPWISGPMTNFGIAKGMWQFIPKTAGRYGLKVGPLLDFRRPDPADERQRFDLSTKAAAHYLKDLYTTDAQASGLLVMACYNWGEDRVLPLVQKMPANPRERNYWRLIARYPEKVPQETYDYVFYIVAAAVIGENPRLFGFDFDNPLLDAGRR
jgi:membrane-bound lytic murein transglycosylase D